MRLPIWAMSWMRLPVDDVIQPSSTALRYRLPAPPACPSSYGSAAAGTVARRTATTTTAPARHPIRIAPALRVTERSRIRHFT
jgi:hypothetical protein